MPQQIPSPIPLQPPPSKPCKHFDVCGRNALDGHIGKCILHSENSEKDEEAFEEALNEHWEERGPDFKWMVFPEGVSFEDATFEGEASFREATFEGEASFREATFEGEASFFEATFEGKAIFEGATFKGKAFFRRATFEGKASFEAMFEGRASFRETTFKGEAFFNEATFEDKVFFSHSTLVGEVLFRKATFKGEASFGGATFKERVSFRGATFAGEVSFRATSWEEFYFGATFEGEASFREATFEGEASFFEATFEGEASFERATFENQVLLSGKSGRNRLFANSEVAFTDVTYNPDTPPHFRFVDLSRCRFARTDLRDVEFTGVKWCDGFAADKWFSLDWLKGKEWFGRVGLYDEVVEYRKRRSFSDLVQATLGRIGSPEGPHWTLFEMEEDSEEEPEEERWHDIERLYRQLKRNYEERGDFPRGGDFHIGEKEARRKNPQTSGPLKFLLYAYRALSKYGERAFPALISLVVVVLGCAVLYSLFGATLVEEATGHTLGITDPEGPLSFSESLRVSLEASFYPVRPIGFEGMGPYILSVIQRLLSPFLLALLALALRQRVKR